MDPTSVFDFPDEEKGRVYKIPIYNKHYMNFNIMWDYDDKGDMWVSCPGCKILFDNWPWFSQEVDRFQNCLCCGMRVSWETSMEIFERLMYHKKYGDCSYQPIELYGPKYVCLKNKIYRKNK